MGVDHKLLLQLFVIVVLVYFAVKLEKDKYRDFIWSQVIAKIISDFHALPGNAQQIFAYNSYLLIVLSSPFFKSNVYH